MRKILSIIVAMALTGCAFAADITVTFKDGQCQAKVAGEAYRCSLGTSGISNDKHEGDGTTPIGEFPLRKVFYRADKISKSQLAHVSLPIQAIDSTDGWCDDPKDSQYNTLVNLKKFNTSINHEEMYRDDDIYNIVIEVGYNDDPIVPGKGSAVFVRVADPDYAGTRGSVAFSQADLLKILPKLNSKSKLIVH